MLISQLKRDCEAWQGFGRSMYYHGMYWHNLVFHSMYFVAFAFTTRSVYFSRSRDPYRHHCRPIWMVQKPLTGGRHLQSGRGPMWAVTARFARIQPIEFDWTEVSMSSLWKGQTLYGRNGNVMLSSKPGSSKLHLSSCIDMSCSSCEQSAGE